MGEEETLEKNEDDGTGSASKSSAALSSADLAKTASDQSKEKEQAEKQSINDIYFSNGNKLMTLPGSSLAVNDDTRRLLALFTDGRFLVVETHKFDGRVLSFEVLARKKKVAIAKPTYVSQNELNAIYSIGERAAAAEGAANDSDLDQLQMQKDFISVVSQAAAKKVVQKLAKENPNYKVEELIKIALKAL